MNGLSSEVHVMLAPARAYAMYATRAGRGGLWIAIRRPLFVSLIQGVAISMVATHTVSAPVLVVVTLCWTIATAVQIVASLIAIGSMSHPHIGTARAIDLWFMGHAPWSLWLLAWAAILTWGWVASGMPWIAVLTMAVPAAITYRIVVAFGEQVLRADRRDAVRRAVLHQVLIWTILILFFSAAVQLWPRIVGFFR